ncbi:MAG: TlpA family protein disulfide reductase [Anaerolineales bacterium]|nr:TlpA family protein disulfide reductase [Anaerolineales bacterium]
MEEAAINESQNPVRSRPRWGRILAWGGLAALLFLLFLGLINSQKGAMKVGEKAPQFTLTTFDGRVIKSEDLRGKVIVLNIWASWCKPCEQEAADLEAAWRYYEPGGSVAFLGVAWTDTDKKSAEYLTKYQITYPNGPDLGTKIYHDFRATGVPETYVIDRHGVLTHVKISPFQSVEEIRQVVDAALER